MVPNEDVAHKLNTIEERRQDQSCLFWLGDYGNKGHNPEKFVLGFSPGEGRFFSSETKYNRRPVPNEDGFCSSETKYNRRTAPTSKLFILAGRLQEQRKQPQKSVPGSSPGEDGFCSPITKQDRRMALRICKHLSNFPAVTLRVNK
jgi:hypothetical protein